MPHLTMRTGTMPRTNCSILGISLSKGEIMKVNKGSWHYKWLAFSTVMSKYRVFEEYEETNRVTQRVRDGVPFSEIYEKYIEYNYTELPYTLCQYWRKVLLTFPLMAIINLLVIGLILFGLYAIFSIAYMEIAAGTLVVIGSALIIGGIIVAQKRIKKYLLDRAYNRVEKTDGLFRNVYRSYKDNVCTIMEYEDETK